MAGAGKPLSYIIFPDEQFGGSSSVVSVTSEDGVGPGPVSPLSANLGKMFPLQSGFLTDEAKEIRYRLVVAGGANNAEWIWRHSTEADTLYRGADDVRRIWGNHAPITASSPGSSNAAATYLHRFNRQIVIGIDDTTDLVTVLSRDVDGFRYDDWAALTTFTLDLPVETGDHNAALIELDNGNALLAVRVTGQLPIVAQVEIDIYMSDDGGATWTKVVDQLIRRSNANNPGLPFIDPDAQIRMARSGDHIRICTAGSADVVLTWLSKDRGSTWKRILDGPTLGDNGDVDDHLPFDIVGLDDGSGTFLMTILATGAATQTNHYRALGASTWQVQSTGVVATGGNVNTIMLARTPTHIVEMVFYTDNASGSLDHWALRRARHEDVFDFLSGWEEVDPVDGLQGIRFGPSRPVFMWIGDGLFAYGARKDEGTLAEVAFPFAWYMGLWTQRSLGEQGPGTSIDFLDAIWTHDWYNNIGEPDEGTGSPWVKTTTAGGTSTTNQNLMAIDGTGVGDQLFFTLTVPNASADHWAFGLDGTLFTWFMQLDPGDGSSGNDDVSVNIISGTSSNTFVDYTIRISGTTVIVRDRIGGVNVSTISGLDIDSGSGGKFHEFRLWLGAGIPDQGGQLVIIDHGTGIVHEGAVFTRPVGVGTRDDIAKFGHVGVQVQATALRSRWRDFRIRSLSTLNQRGFVNPTSQFGQLTASEVHRVEQGLRATWGGAGGLIDDEFVGSLTHPYQVENVLIDSPRIQWRSTGQAAQTIIFDADPVNGLGRFAHDSIATFNTTDRSIVVDYDDDVGFGSAVAAGTIDATIYGPMTVAAIQGSTFRIDETPATFTAPLPVRGGAHRLFVRPTNGGAIDLTWRVTRHAQGQRLHFAEETVDLATQGLGVGDSVVIYADRGTLDYGGQIVRRFLRLQLSDTDTADADHRLGTLIAGSRYDFGVPLDWRHGDNEQPNITTHRTRSAIGWAFEEGPPQRTLTARVIGDASQRDREILRNMLRQIGYEKRPVALIRDEDNPTETLQLGRVVSGAQFDNSVWFTDPDGASRVGGDLPFTFVEEP